MNILFISTKSPYPIKDGHSSRTYNVIRQISKTHTIFLLTYFLSREEETEFPEMRKIAHAAQGFALKTHASKFHTMLCWLKSLILFKPFTAVKYETPAMGKAIRATLKNNHIDIIHVDLLPLMCFNSLFKKHPVVLTNHNVESDLVRRKVKHIKNPLLKAVFFLEWIKLRTFEKKHIAGVDCCIAVSEVDKLLLGQLNPRAKLAVIPNGVDIHFFKPVAAPPANTLIYVGGLDWFPNKDAIDYYCGQIYPKLRARLGDVKLKVIGKIPEGCREYDSVEYTGYVPDIRPHVAHAHVYIVPLRIGGGTRLKILDALAMGKAVVSTTIGCEGLEVSHGLDILIADTAESFAQAIEELFTNDAKRGELERNARRCAEEKYDWDVLGAALNSIYTHLEHKE